MVNFKRMDEKDFVFIKKPLNRQEEKEFSDFLKIRKSRARAKSSPKVKLGKTNNWHNNKEIDEKLTAQERRW